MDQTNATKGLSRDNKQHRNGYGFGRLGLDDILRTALFLALAMMLVIGDAVLLGDVFHQQVEWLAALITVLLLLTVAGCTRVLQIWGALKPARQKIAIRRDEHEMKIVQSGFRELFIYLIVGLILIASVPYLLTMPMVQVLVEINLTDASSDPVPVLVLLAFFAASFIPLVLAFWLTGRHDQSHFNQQLFRDDVVSPLSLGISSVAIIGVFALAWAAGNNLFVMTNNFGLFVMLIVMACFVAFIFTGHVVSFWYSKSEANLRGRVMQNGLSSSCVGVVSRVDSALVRLVAPLSGATQNGPVLLPHVLVLLVIMPLSALGYILATPYGLIPIGVAALIALSLGRRWAWVEADRETASRLQSTTASDIHIGFDNDLKDEALLGYASLFVLVPLALHQMQGWTGAFIETDISTGNAFFDWLRFFGAELAKAVPFVDWWEIYSVDVSTPFEIGDGGGNETAKHLTFMARAVVDLVIMAALFQALTIWQRGRTQHRLFDTGQLNAFDPFTERGFFQRGMYKPKDSDTLEPKADFTLRVKEHVDAQSQRGQERLPYSRERLSELIESEYPDVQAGAKWMIDHFGVLAGPPPVQLKQLRERWINMDMARKAINPGDDDKVWIRAEKIEFERLLGALAQDPNSFQREEIGTLVGLLGEVKNNPEFSFSQVLALELLSTRPTTDAIYALACHLVTNSWDDAQKVWRARFSQSWGTPSPSLYLGHREMRLKVLDAVAEIDFSARISEQVFTLLSELLEDVSIYDGANAVQDRAAELKKKILSANALDSLI